jgi:hypothetical protein
MLDPMEQPTAMTVKDDTEARDLRRPAVAKKRRCLMCSEAFESAWAGERICRRCKSTDRWRAG